MKVEEKKQVSIRPADVAMVWGTMLEKGKDVKAPEMFTKAEKYGFTKQEADSIRRWEELQPLARKFKSQALKKHDDAMEQLYALGKGSDPEKEAELELTIFRERVENNYATVWLLEEHDGHQRYSCVLINGSYDECKAWVADNHLEDITEVTFDPEFLKWDLEFHIKWEKEQTEKRKNLNPEP